MQSLPPMTITLVSTRPEKEIKSVKLHFDAQAPENEVLTKEVIEIALAQLSNIARLYAKRMDYDDPLSRKLHIWCLEVIRDFDPNQTMDKEYIEDIAARIHELTHEILVNPLDSSPMRNPILVNDELPLWDMATWNGYQRSFGMPSQEDREHEFAADLIAWRNELPIAELNPTIELTQPGFQPLQELVGRLPKPTIEEVEDDIPLTSKQIMYVTMRAVALDNQREENTTEFLSGQVKAIRALWQDAQKQIVEMKDEIKKRELERTERINQSLASMQKTYNASLSNMHAAYQKSLTTMENNYRIEAQAMSQHLNALQGQLNTAVARANANERQVALQTGELHALRGQFASLAASNAANSRAARKGGRSCIIS